MSKVLIIIPFVVLLVTLSGFRIPYSSSIVFQTCQPKNVKYGSFDPYCAGVVEKKFLLTDECHIRIVREADSLIKGYGFDVLAPFECHASHVEIVWNDNGVEVSQRSKESSESILRLNLPKALFATVR